MKKRRKRANLVVLFNVYHLRKDKMFCVNNLEAQAHNFGFVLAMIHVTCFESLTVISFHAFSKLDHLFFQLYLVVIRHIKLC